MRYLVRLKNPLSIKKSPGEMNLRLLVRSNPCLLPYKNPWPRAYMYVASFSSPCLQAAGDADVNHSLQKEVEKLRAINRQMYDFAVNRLVTS